MANHCIKKRRQKFLIEFSIYNFRAKFALGFRPTEEREESSPPDPPSPHSPPPPEEAERIISTLLPK